MTSFMCMSIHTPVLCVYALFVCMYVLLMCMSLHTNVYSKAVSFHEAD